MATLAIKNQHIYTPRDRDVLLLSFRGLISAQTIDTFRDALRKATGVGCPVILDFSEVTYVNSTGLGKLVLFFDKLNEKGQSGCLVCISSESFKLIQMLGLHEVLLIYSSISDGLAAIDDESNNLVPARRIVKNAISNRSFRITSLPEPRLPQARILIGVSPQDSMSKLLVRGLSGDGSNVVITESFTEIQQMLREGKVFDIAIIDEALPSYQQICLALKTIHTGSLISIIKVSSNSANTSNLYVCADEVIKEPFDVQELFALAQSEYDRTQLESILFVQDIALNFSSSQSGVEEGLAMFEDLASSCGLDELEKNKFIQAVCEAVDNARKHGNKADPFKSIKLTYILDKEKVTVVVEDEGKGFDFKRRLDMAKNFTPLEQARMISFDEDKAGLGINIMLKCCDSIEYTAPGNCVRLTKYV